MLHVHVTCPCCTYAACQCCSFIMHVFACPFCMPMLHVHAIQYVYASFPCSISMSHTTCSCHLSMLLVHVGCLSCTNHAAFPCCRLDHGAFPCCMSIVACSCCITVLPVHATTYAACQCCMPMLHAHASKLPVQVAVVRKSNFEGSQLHVTFLVLTSATD
jgi:hypothetical protein